MQETGNKTTTIDFEVRVKTLDTNKGELVDAMVAGAKLTKADAGRVLGYSQKDTLVVRVEPLENEKGITLPNITLESYSKTIAAESEKTA